MVALDTLYNNFEMTTALFFYSGDKNLETIQQIMTFTAAANFAKQAVDVTTHLDIIIKK